MLDNCEAAINKTGNADKLMIKTVGSAINIMTYVSKEEAKEQGIPYNKLS